MILKLTQFFNRTQNHNFTFKTDKVNIEYLQKIIIEIQKEINKNLLKRPDTTCNWLKSIYLQIQEGQKYIHKRYILDIEDRIYKKQNDISDQAHENFEGAGIILNDIDDIKQMIIQAIQTVKPELINVKKSKPKEISSPADLLKKNTIKIDIKVLHEVYNELKEYFTPEEHTNLTDLLKGKNISEKLIFKGNKNQLTELFKRIEYNNYFISSPEKTNIAKWIVKNFTTLKKGDFVYDQVYKEELSKTGFGIRKSKRICNSIIFLNEDALKQRNTDNLK